MALIDQLDSDRQRQSAEDAQRFIDYVQQLERQRELENEDDDPLQNQIDEDERIAHQLQEDDD